MLKDKYIDKSLELSCFSRRERTKQTALNSTFQLVWDYVISSYCHYYRGDRVFVKDRVNLPPQLSVLLFDLMMSRDALRNRHLY